MRLIVRTIRSSGRGSSGHDHAVAVVIAIAEKYCNVPTKDGKRALGVATICHGRGGGRFEKRSQQPKDETSLVSEGGEVQ